MSQYSRPSRLAERIQQIIALRIDKGLRDPRLGFVTITDVKVSGDSQHASIFYTVYGNEKEREDSALALKAATGLFRTELGKNLNIRLVPTLEFILDALPDSADSINSLLSEARERDNAIRSLAAEADYVADADPYKKSEQEEEIED